jgi:hypothetical protein
MRRERGESLCARVAYLAVVDGRSASPLGVVTFTSLPDGLFRIAAAGMALHVLCSWLLRASVDPDTALFAALFETPLLGSLERGPWLMRGRYFLPWRAAPPELRGGPLAFRSLFWGARLGAVVLIVGLLAFLVAMIWEVVGDDA